MTSPLLALAASALALLLVAGIGAWSHHRETGAWPPWALWLALGAASVLAAGLALVRRPAPVQAPPVAPPERVVRTAMDIAIANGAARRLEIDRAAKDPERLAAIMREQR